MCVHMLRAILFAYYVTNSVTELTAALACVNRAHACVWVGLIHR